MRVPPDDCAVVAGSTPVVSLGHPLLPEIATLGVNPSSNEFLSRDGTLLTRTSGDSRHLSPSRVARARGDRPEATARNVDDCAAYFERRQAVLDGPEFGLWPAGRRGTISGVPALVPKGHSFNPHTPRSHPAHKAGRLDSRAALHLIRGTTTRNQRRRKSSRPKAVETATGIWGCPTESEGALRRGHHPERQGDLEGCTNPDTWRLTCGLAAGDGDEPAPLSMPGKRSSAFIRLLGGEIG